jgi:uncharacterized damage-inducible protein DinB
MNDLPEYLRRAFTRDLESLQREIELFPSDEAVWQTVPGIANSAGNLALHVAGNLEHYIGRVLGGSGYVRDREREFSSRGLPRAEVLQRLRSAHAAVTGALAGLTAAVLSAPYPEKVGELTVRTDCYLLHLSSHLAFHLGQAGYLRRAVTGDGTSTRAISPAVCGLPAGAGAAA